MLGPEPFGRGVVKALMSVVDGTAAVAAESSTQFDQFVGSKEESDSG